VKVTNEREIKLEAPAGFELPELDGSPLAPRVFSSTYYDTPNVSLARAGLTLRRRLESGVGLWQLKLPAEEGRLELEQPGGPAVPTELTELLPAHLRFGELAPIAELHTRRTGVLIDSDGARAEVVLDEVEVMDARRVAGAFAELEVELQSGDAGRLRPIAQSLRRAGARDGVGVPKVFRALGRGAEEPAGGLRGAVALQLRQIMAHDPGTRLGDDPESLHQHRVAARRLRAFLRAARPLLENRERVEALRAELGWLGSALGPVRDLDVMLDHLRAEVASLGIDTRGAVPLLKALERARTRARRSMLAALSSSRYFVLLDEIEGVTAELPLLEDELPRLARKEFRRLTRAVAAAGDDPDDETLHALRIRGKRARYAAELTGGMGAPFVVRAKRFQDVLGTHQDTVVIEARLRELTAADGDHARAIAAGRLIERERVRRAEARGGWWKVWRALERCGRSTWT
jgi:CHAD domain-containing protein